MATIPPSRTSTSPFRVFVDFGILRSRCRSGAGHLSIPRSYDAAVLVTTPPDNSLLLWQVRNGDRGPARRPEGTSWESWPLSHLRSQCRFLARR